MKKKLYKNASFNTIAQAISLLLSILFVPFYISRLSIAGFGVYCFINLFLGWITTLQMGLEPTVIKLTSKYYAQHQYEKLNKLITISSIFQVILGSLIAISTWIFSGPLIHLIIKNNLEYLHEGRIALQWAALNIIILMLKNVLFSTLKGFQRYDIFSMLFTSFNLLSSLLAALFVWLGYGIPGMVKARLIVNLLFVIISYITLKRTFVFLKSNFSFDKSLLKEILNFGSWIALGRINRLGINALPPLLIGKLIGPEGIAYYNISSKIILAANNLLASGISVIFPFISELHSLKLKTRIQRIYTKSNKYLSLASIPLYCFLFIFSYDILNTWLGKETADACWLLMTILSFGYYLSSSTMVPTNFTLGLGNTKILAINGILQLIVILATLPALLNHYGIVGAGLNLILFETVGLVTGIFITIKLVNASAFQFWVKDRCYHLLIGMIAFIIVYLVKNYFLLEFLKLPAIFNLGAIFLTGTLIFLLLANSLGIIDREFKDQIGRLFKGGNK